MNRGVGKVKRTDKLNAEFTKDVYDIITRKIKNPDITEMFSIVKMDISPDLAQAKVFLSIFSVNPEKKKRTFNAIVSESKRIRHQLAMVSHTRTVPELHFYMDDSMEYGDKMDKLFKKISEEEK